MENPPITDEIADLPSSTRRSKATLKQQPTKTAASHCEHDEPTDPTVQEEEDEQVTLSPTSVSRRAWEAERTGFLPEMEPLSPPTMAKATVTRHTSRRSLTKTPSFSRAGAWLQRYPSLSRVRELASFRSSLHMSATSMSMGASSSERTTTGNHDSFPKFPVVGDHDGVDASPQHDGRLATTIDATAASHATAAIGQPNLVRIETRHIPQVSLDVAELHSSLSSWNNEDSTSDHGDPTASPKIAPVVKGMERLNMFGRPSLVKDGPLEFSGSTLECVEEDVESTVTTTTTTWDDLNIEVYPGVHKRLRGSQETNDALERGDCVEVVCLVCTVPLACLLDCEGVVCPLCLSMTPIDSPLLDKDRVSGSVCLGIELDEE